MRNFLLLAVMFVWSVSLAQEPMTNAYKDFQVWQKLEVEYNFTKRWLVQVQEQARFTDNATRFSYYYIDFGGVYKLTKNLRLDVDYIYIQKFHRSGIPSNRHQYNIYLNYRKKFGRFTFFNRLLTEGQFKNYNTSRDGHYLRDFYLRDKVTLRYKINRFIPYVADELYYKFDGPMYNRGFNRNRVFAGILFKVSATWLFEVFYMYENNMLLKVPVQNYVFGFGIQRSFFQ